MIDYNGKTVFLGIDVHKKSYSVTAVCDGCIVKHDTLTALPGVLMKYCNRAFKGASIKSAYEAGFCGFYLHRYLNSAGIENIVVHPASIEVESRNLKKTDKRDSKKIAVQLAAGRLQCVFVPSVEQESIRSVSRLREAFSRQRIRVSSQLKALLNVQSLIPWDQKPAISKKWLAGLLENLNVDEKLEFCIERYIKEWYYLSDELVKIDKYLAVLIPEDLELYKTYRKIPGFGPIISRILISELGDTLQFSNEEKLFSFCGLTPSEHSSGEHKRLGHISRQGNPILRKVLVQAAWVAVRKDLYFSTFYTQLAIRRGKSKAIVAVARKLIGRARCAIKKKELYLDVKAET